MNFGERNGFEKKKSIQIENMSPMLRNKLFNQFNTAYHALDYPLDVDCVEYIVDKLGYVSYSKQNDMSQIEERFLQESDDSIWYDPYNIIEYFLQFLRKILECEGTCSSCSKIEYCQSSKFMKNFISIVNQVLEDEVSGYRTVNDMFSPITNTDEIRSINESISANTTASIHFAKALELYSSKENRDYENSIKESITAVESMCCVIVGQNGTLGSTLKKLEDCGIVIHPALKEAFSKLYGYTSDVGGIRHGSINFQGASSEDAKYMLVSCSAFVNYLQEKLTKMDGTI